MPDKMVAFYDGDCRICQASASAVARLDRTASIEFKPLQSSDGSVPMELLEAQIHVVSSDGNVAAGWEAVVAMAAQIRQLRWLHDLNRFTIVQRSGRVLYGWVARHRHWPVGRR